MMEYKPGGGYSGKGYTSPKKQAQKALLLIVGFLAGIFGLAALVFGWWSILLDFGIIAYLMWIGKYVKSKEA